MSLTNLSVPSSLFSKNPLKSLPRQTMTDCSEEPEPSPDSSSLPVSPPRPPVGGVRRERSIGPTICLTDRWAPSERSARPLAARLCSLHAPFQTPQRAASQWLLRTLAGREFSQLFPRSAPRVVSHENTASSSRNVVIVFSTVRFCKFLETCTGSSSSFFAVM